MSDPTVDMYSFFLGIAEERARILHVLDNDESVCSDYVASLIRKSINE